MNRTLVLLGIVILLVGVLSIPYGVFRREGAREYDLGPLTVQVPETRTYTIPRWMSWTLIAAGSVVIGFALAMKEGPARQQEGRS